MARLEIISAVIYEALLAFQLCISGRGNELKTTSTDRAIRILRVFYVSNANLSDFSYFTSRGNIPPPGNRFSVESFKFSSDFSPRFASNVSARLS